MLYRNLGLPQGPFTLKSIRIPSNTHLVVLLRRIRTRSLRVHRAFCLPCTSNCNCPKSSFSYSPPRLTMRLVGPITALQHADRLGDSPTVPFISNSRAPMTVVVVGIVIRIVLSIEIARLDDRKLADLRVVSVPSLVPSSPYTASFPFRRARFGKADLTLWGTMTFSKLSRPCRPQNKRYHCGSFLALV